MLTINSPFLNKLILNKKRIVLTGLIIIVGLFLAYSVSTLIYSLSNAPKKVRVSNLTDKSFTVTWITQRPDYGVVIYGESADLLVGPFGKAGQKVAYDDRDYSKALLEKSNANTKNAAVGEEIKLLDNEVSKLGSYYVHHVTVRDLDQTKQYFFRVGNTVTYWDVTGCDQAPSALEPETATEFTTTTLKANDSYIPTPNPAYGKIYGEIVEDGGEPVDDSKPEALVFVSALSGKDSELSLLTSSVTNEIGGWSIDKSNFRMQDGIYYPSLKPNEGQLLIQTQYKSLPGVNKRYVYVGSDSPVEGIIFQFSAKELDSSIFSKLLGRSYAKLDKESEIEEKAVVTPAAPKPVSNVKPDPVVDEGCKSKAQCMADYGANYRCKRSGGVGECVSQVSEGGACQLNNNQCGDNGCGGKHPDCELGKCISGQCITDSRGADEQPEDCGGVGQRPCTKTGKEVCDEGYAYYQCVNQCFLVNTPTNVACKNISCDSATGACNYPYTYGDCTNDPGIDPTTAKGLCPANTVCKPTLMQNQVYSSNSGLVGKALAGGDGVMWKCVDSKCINDSFCPLPGMFCNQTSGDCEIKGCTEDKQCNGYSDQPEGDVVYSCKSGLCIAKEKCYELSTGGVECDPLAVSSKSLEVSKLLAMNGGKGCNPDDPKSCKVGFECKSANLPQYTDERTHGLSLYVCSPNAYFMGSLEGTAEDYHIKECTTVNDCYGEAKSTGTDTTKIFYGCEQGYCVEKGTKGAACNEEKDATGVVQSSCAGGYSCNTKEGVCEPNQKMYCTGLTDEQCTRSCVIAADCNDKDLVCSGGSCVNKELFASEQCTLEQNLGSPTIDKKCIVGVLNGERVCEGPISCENGEVCTPVSSNSNLPYLDGVNVSVCTKMSDIKDGCYSDEQCKYTSVDYLSSSSDVFRCDHQTGLCVMDKDDREGYSMCSHTTPCKDGYACVTSSVTKESRCQPIPSTLDDADGKAQRALWRSWGAGGEMSVECYSQKDTNKGQVLADNCEALGMTCATQTGNCTAAKVYVPVGAAEVNATEASKSSFVFSAFAQDDKELVQKSLVDDEVVYFAESGMYNFELGEGYQIQNLEVNKNASYVFYLERDGQTGYQPPVNAQNPLPTEDVLVDATGVNVKINKVADKFPVQLSRGINIVSFPFLPSLDGVTSLKASELMKLINKDKVIVTAITYFDNTSGVWAGGIVNKTNVPTSFIGEDFPVTFGKGYLIRVDPTATIEAVNVPGYDLESVVPLQLTRGWNLVGIHGSVQDKTAVSLINEMNESTQLTADNVTYWSTSRSLYQGVVVADGEEYGFDFPLSKGIGYFVRVKEITDKDKTTVQWTPK